jgi:hypothetical protein
VLKSTVVRDSVEIAEDSCFDRSIPPLSVTFGCDSNLTQMTCRTFCDCSSLVASSSRGRSKLLVVAVFGTATRWKM